MRDFTGARFLLFLIPPVFLLLPLAAIIVILNRISTSSLRGVTENDWRTGDSTITLNGPLTTGSTNHTNIDVTVNYNPAPPIAILLVALVACFISALGGFGTWELRKVEGTPKYQRGWAWTVITTYLIMIASGVGVFAYTTAVQNSEGWQRYEDVSKPNQRYTRETWVCQIDKFFPAQDWAGRACGTARAARILMVVMAAAGLISLGVVWILIHERGGVKWLFGGKGRYGGFANYHEMQPGTPNPYAAQASPQWPQHQQQQWMPPQQQWGPSQQQQWGPPQQQWAPQQQWMPQQPIQQWAGQPNFQQMPPQIPQQAPPQKSGATAEERPVFR